MVILPIRGQENLYLICDRAFDACNPDFGVRGLRDQEPKAIVFAGTQQLQRCERAVILSLFPHRLHVSISAALAATVTAGSAAAAPLAGRILNPELLFRSTFRIEPDDEPFLQHSSAHDGVACAKQDV
jgi:hypothetical protein